MSKNCQNTLYALKFTSYQGAIHLEKNVMNTLDQVVTMKIQTLLIFSELTDVIDFRESNTEIYHILYIDL
jgi:virulence-associated protein VapD